MRRYLEALSDASSDSTNGSPQYRAAEARAPTAGREGRPVTRRIIRALTLGAGRSSRPHRRHRWAVINNPDATSDESRERGVTTRWSARMGPNAKSKGARGGLDRLISTMSPHQSLDRYPRRRREGRRERRGSGEVVHPGYPVGSRDGMDGERRRSGGRRERIGRWEEEEEGRQLKQGRKRDEPIEHRRCRQKSLRALRRRRLGSEERHERERTLREAVEQAESERRRGERERGRTNDRREGERRERGARKRQASDAQDEEEVGRVGTLGETSEWDRGKEVEKPGRVRRDKERQNSEGTQGGRTMLVEKGGKTQQQLRWRSSDEPGRVRPGRTEQRRQVDGGRQHGDGVVEGRRQRRRPSRGGDEEGIEWEQPGEEQYSKNQRSKTRHRGGDGRRSSRPARQVGERGAEQRRARKPRAREKRRGGSSP